jgi:glycosyltransferase involved in cell wall biosynthesis
VTIRENPAPDTRSRELPSVCTIVCIHNVAEWIEEALTSVAVQSSRLRNHELVLVDVESTDASLATAQRVLTNFQIAGRVLRVPNRGPGAARNVGWRNTKKEWIQFLDGDDVLHEWKLETQLERAASSSSDVAVIFSPWTSLRLQDGHWRRDTDVQMATFGTDPLSDLLRADGFVATGSQIFRRAWLEKVGGFNETLWLIEDVELMMRLAMQGGAFLEARCDEPLFFYRRRDGLSLSTKDATAFIDGCVRNARMVEEHWRKAGELTECRSRRLLNAYLFAARFYASKHKRRFEDVLGQIAGIEPKFVPDAPRHLKYASRVFGYRRAERMATVYRRIKDVVCEGG